MAERHLDFDLDEETWIRVQQKAAKEHKTVARVAAELFQWYAARMHDPDPPVDVKAVRDAIRRRNRLRMFEDEG